MQTIIQKTLEDTMYSGTIPVFIYKINYPCFTTSCSTSSAQAINDYYVRNAKSTEIYCRTTLFPLASENVKFIQSDRPFNSYTLDVNYKITYNDGCITSLYQDTYTYMGGAHGETKRISDTWNFESGVLLQLNNIYPFTPKCLYTLQKKIEHQIEERLLLSPGSYFDNYSYLIKNSFNPASYYLIPNNLVIYFQQYDIAPYSTGLPEFLISCEV